MSRPWSVYLLKLADGSFYAGATTDVRRRFGRHVSGRGSKYVRSRLPAELAYVKLVGEKRVALRRERALKRLPRSAKLDLARRWSGARS